MAWTEQSVRVAGYCALHKCQGGRGQFLKKNEKSLSFCHGRGISASVKRTIQMHVTPEFMRRLAAVAAAETLPRFRSEGAVANKLGVGFDPVTEADREAERALKSLILQEFPDHGVLGEEHGTVNAGSRYKWVIDPIDGTRAFISGLPVWGTLVGLTIDGDAVAGMMSQPFTNELFY